MTPRAAAPRRHTRAFRLVAAVLLALVAVVASDLATAYAGTYTVQASGWSVGYFGPMVPSGGQAYNQVGFDFPAGTTGSLNVVAYFRRAAGTTYSSTVATGNWADSLRYSQTGYKFQPIASASTDVTYRIQAYVSGTLVLDYDDTTPPTPLCSSAQISDVAVSYSAGTLSARAKVSTSTWSTIAVDAPDPGALASTHQLTLTKAGSLVDGAPGYYYGTAALASLSPMTARLTLLNGSNSVCYLSAAVSAATIRADGSSSGAVNPDDSSTDCGWNAFCYIKAALRWAFVPSSSTMGSWSSHVDSIKSRPPISFIVSGLSIVTGAAAQLGCGIAGNCGDGNPTPSTTIQSQARLQAPDSAVQVDLIDSAGDLMQDTAGGQLVYAIASLAITVAFAFRMWHRVTGALGGGGAA